MKWLLYGRQNGYSIGDIVEAIWWYSGCNMVTKQSLFGYMVAAIWLLGGCHMGYKVHTTPFIISCRGSVGLTWAQNCWQKFSHSDPESMPSKMDARKILLHTSNFWKFRKIQKIYIPEDWKNKLHNRSSQPTYLVPWCPT